MSVAGVFLSVVMEKRKKSGGASTKFFKRDYRQGIVPPNAGAWDRISRLRIGEAESLVGTSKWWNGAVYLAGLAVEARLKWFALLSTTVTPKKVVEYRHKLELLSHDTGLFTPILSALGSTWHYFRFWDVQIRYESNPIRKDAGVRFFLAATTILDIINAESRKRGFIQ